VIALNKVSLLADRKGKLLVQIDDENGYLVDEDVLRLFASTEDSVMSFGDGTPGSHNEFIKHLVRDYANIYRKLESLGELKITT